ncbi:MAG: TRAP transporter large permease subunit, partial [Rhodospirillales bacterium]|nr:TRAP transporter large permease subunit [Rhodospirillales bacterium]
MTLAIVVVVLLLLLFSGLQVAFSLAGLGTVMLMIKGLPLIMVAQNLHGAVDNFILLSVPLFLLMSNILLKGGVGRDLFDAVQSWVGHWPGGMGVATLLSCGLFSAISGSSVATAATVGTVAIPEMTKRGYSRPFTFGLLAAGGTLGILIPPSIPLIVYGVIAEESIGKLFLAGVGPGILLIVLFSIYA